MLPFSLRCARRCWVKASSDGPRRAGKLEIHCHNIRDYTQDKHRRVDDTPYGGGKGMLMQTEPIYNCYQAVL